MLLAASPTHVIAQQAAPSNPASPTYTVPLGIALEEYSYPFPVRYLPLQAEGEPVRMAYMDVPAVLPPGP